MNILKGRAENETVEISCMVYPLANQTHGRTEQPAEVASSRKGQGETGGNKMKQHNYFKHGEDRVVKDTMTITFSKTVPYWLKDRIETGLERAKK
jgi:hypothetical protein